jgi:hypothetical protein
LPRLDTPRSADASRRVTGLGLAAAALWALGGIAAQDPAARGRRARGSHASRADQAGVLLAVVSAVLYSFYLLL